MLEVVCSAMGSSASPRGCLHPTEAPAAPPPRNRGGAQSASWKARVPWSQAAFASTQTLLTSEIGIHFLYMSWM